MLEHVPSWLGTLMRNFRAGHDKLVVAHRGIALAEERIELTSPAFKDGQRLPTRFTADGDGISPPLMWGDVPVGTRSLVLIVEDPDAPTPNPLVHAVVLNIPTDQRNLREGAIVADEHERGGSQSIGRNSYFSESWLPPDPPTGHGEHDYVFQLFALDVVPEIGPNSGRGDVVAAIAGHVLGTGLLVGTYSRDASELSQAANGEAAISPAA
ncbi:YbhB/YbcL family Raf kinase inhibitor-like protein [Sphingomonas panacisoli]|uniref:YbhB/YbcL family Raf kinase inhibitor-like protein n=1 Tax=Sphingomonas panacisoli TaxID=1813879 RepID=A0A5B8LFJ0_9SPHN|nr:YbhB/YbcL family Raf kinase inhibitor-like protein [Sphingomonas panacisoli]QDZ06851.1 YbhB/YbcL family Raf kinase inhibitor-like protein [Sphingomonas panacisoli]